jgi:hypothetical protein
MNKTISVNPSFFNISKKNKTRKTNTANQPNIKVKSQSPKTNKNVNRTILQFIRKKQQQRYNDMHEPVKNGNTEREIKTESLATPEISQSQNLSNDFEESLKYLSSISTDPKPEHNNTTLKKTTGYIKDNEHLFNSYIGNTNIPTYTHTNNQLQVKEPPYGCLKQIAGGSKPTYRQYIRNTIKSHPQIQPQPHHQIQPQLHHQIQPHHQNQPHRQIQHHHQIQPQPQPQPYPQMHPQLPTQSLAEIQSIPVYKYKNIIDRTEELIKIKNKNKDLLKEPVRRKKRRIIKNRTFKTGKRRNTLSVLLSTKTKKNETLNKTRRLKTVSLPEIKKELIKQGLIRVGTTTPPEILRKIYESVNLICGKVNNRNPENLLYNFIHDTD